MWTIVGTVSTIWAILIALLLAILADVRAWTTERAAWLIPVLFICVYALSVAGGFLTGGAARARGLTAASSLPAALTAFRAPNFAYATLATVLEREGDAKTVWLVTPHLFYDIYSPAFRQVITKNKSAGIKYRYICPDTPNIQNNLQVYRSLYKDSSEIMEEQFLVLPDSKLSDFLTEIAIYDAGYPTMYAFAIPPSAR